MVCLEWHEGMAPRGVEVEWDGEPFDINQSDLTGCLYIQNMLVTCNGEIIPMYLPYNSRDPYPLQFGEEGERVFNADGTFSTEFLYEMYRIYDEIEGQSASAIL